MEEKQVRKIYAEPQEEEITISGEKHKVWLHPLSYPVQKSVCLGRFREVHQMLTSTGTEVEVASQAADMAYRSQMILFCVRVGKEDSAISFFKDAKQVFALNPEEMINLSSRLLELFEITEEDLGNSLRARIHAS